MSAPQVVRTTVLVADDDALVRGVLRMALARLGHEVREAVDATETVAIARESLPRLVILDINMPGGSVHSTLDALREIDPSVTVLVLSGEPQPPAGVVGPLCAFARKPIELDELASHVGHLLAAQAGQVSGSS